MNILELIAQDHRKAETLFSKIEHEKDAKKLHKLFGEIYEELNLHAQAEELVFYPALRDYEDTEDLLEEATEEHNSVKVLLEQMRQLQPADNEFKTKLGHLKEAVQHHVEEEESDIFEVVQEVMQDKALQALGKQFQETKAKIKADVEAALSR